MSSGKSDGHFKRVDSAFRNFISKEKGSKYTPEAGRYALYVSPGCPWAHRTMITRILKGLEDVVDLIHVHKSMGPEGWYFSGEGESPPKDPLYGFTKLKQLYEKADPAYVGIYSVPVLWDKKTGTMVNNESSEIIRMFYTVFDDLIPEELREENRPGGGLYPAALRKDIDEMNAWVYDTVNNGVYKTGFAKSQEAYDANVHAVFASLDKLESALGHGKRFLFGDHLTEADIRLYTTLARFDVAYNPVFLCNLGSIRHSYPRLYLWLRRLYWDTDQGGEARGAFYRTTEPYMKHYEAGYAAARHRVVFQGAGPLIVPAGPAVLIDPLPSS
ncbi:related to ECM4 - protein involved in cell wall biogenesis and architecture [Cephalotrichum gorgonifer]|uniref:Related to ECM4 - protein involved in cell wall biogenesis and architecture n=1 Tax=Cephalotrichum gorgonifer TaxID=2041049 RepID=A0AAE8N509_9PEZI|nr:related to ECM4 - protein involved in cell wall biogenesis and architecture [Cephalotrichum gorgonifer]